jgi:long-chain fatty acid transport protein
MTRIPFILAASLGMTGVASANAFLLNEFDSKAVGRGNASTATDTDPSSIYYNIGGLAAGSGTSFMIGGALIAPAASYTDPAGMKTDSNTSPQVVPHVFISHRINSMFAAGIGFYTPFGLAISWPDNWVQSEVNHKTSLRTFFITPSFGVNLGSFVPGLTLGAGIDLVPATVELQQDVYFGADRGTAHLGGSAFGIGGRIGLMYVPHSAPNVSVGLMWRSQVKEDFTGNADFDAPAPYRSQLPADGDVKTSVTLPQQIAGGVAVRPNSSLELEANLIWTQWSKFKSLDIEVPAATGGGTMTISQIQNYDDKLTLRVGAEYKFPRLRSAVRAGYIYDPSPVPAEHLTAQLPDVDRHDVTLGGSISFPKATPIVGGLDVHLGFLWVLPKTRETSSGPTPQYKGSYDVSAFVASLTLGGRFGDTK